MATRSTEATVRQRQGRFGRLAAPPGPGTQVRCSCDRCGAHVLALALGGERCQGVCLVCGSERLSRV
jgi:hypothetical protein